MMTKRTISLACASAGLLLLSGCSMAPANVRPETPVPTAWPSGDAYLQQNEAGLPSVSYRDIFHDPRLQSLVEQALQNNRDIRIAAANIAAARAQLRIQRADQLPQLTVSGSADRADTNSSPATSNYVLRGGISAFELDLFGRLASATEAERQRMLATEAAARTVQVGLVSDLAEAWAVHAADAELLQIAENTAVNARRSVELTRLRLRGGIAPRSDVRQAELILATAESDIAAQKTALAQDANLIQLLVGQPVDPALLPRSLADAAESFATLAPGTSSEVLLRRPDVLEAEHVLWAANANIGVARAQLFPRISLTGLLGLASTSLGALFESGSFTKSAGADASYSIFSAGAGRANVAASQAQRDAALASYEKAIQTAFREVADALARQGTIADELRAANNRVTASADNARLADARYKGGISSFLESLDAQRSLYSAQQIDVATRLTMVRNRVALYRALGGDQLSASNQR